jgi:hypothetical protein
MGNIGVNTGTVTLHGGPYHGVDVPRPTDRWGRITLSEGGHEPGETVYRYRPKRDGSYVYDGPDTVLFKLPAVGAA